MPDDQSEYRIKISLDTADATAGAEQFAASAGKIGGSAEGGVKGIHKLVEEAGSMRESRRLATELFETMQGGGETVQGLTGIFRVLLVTMADVNPVVAALGLVGGALVALGLKHQDHAEKAEQSKSATDDVKASVEDLDRTAAGAYSDMLGQLQRITAEYKAQVEAIHEVQKAKDELENAQMAGELAADEEQEGIESAGKDSAQRGEIARRHEENRLKIRQRYAEAAAAQEIKDKQDAVAEAQEALAENRREAGTVGDNLSQAYDTLHGGAAADVVAAGVKSDAQDAADRLQELITRANSIDIKGDRRGLTGDEELEYENLQRTVPQLQQREGVKGPSFDSQLTALQARQKELQEDENNTRDPGLLARFAAGARDVFGGESPEDRAAKDRAQLDQIAAQITAIETYNARIKAAQDEIAKSTPKFQELNGAVDALTLKIQAAQINVQTAQAKADTLGATDRRETFSLDQKQAEQVAEQTYTDTQAKRDALKDDLEAKLKGTDDVAQRGLLEREIADVVAAGIKAKASFDLKFGKIDQTQFNAELEKALDTQKEAGSRATSEGDREQLAALKQKVEMLEKQIAARPDHKALEPLVKAATAMADPVKQVPALMSILAQQVGVVVDAHQGLAKGLGQAQRDISDLQKKTAQIFRSARNNHL